MMSPFPSSINSYRLETTKSVHFLESKSHWNTHTYAHARIQAWPRCFLVLHCRITAWGTETVSSASRKRQRGARAPTDRGMQQFPRPSVR